MPCCSATPAPAATIWSIAAATARSAGSNRPGASAEPSMSTLGEILSPRAIVATMQVRNKKLLFQQLAQIAAELTGADPRVIVDRLNEREKLGSTGFGGGVAIPHGKLDGLGHVIGVF